MTNHVIVPDSRSGVGSTHSEGKPPSLGSHLSEPAYVLTFIAPALRCNQQCPKCYISEVRQEMASSFGLTPEDYVEFAKSFVDKEKKILTLCFQGYEVTLPQSWPYLEALFQFALDHGIRRSFITNGMLLHRHTSRILKLEPARISVSLDGADPDTNDRHRGLKGAFNATVGSLTKFLSAAAHYRRRVAIVSVLYGNENFESLLRMPSLVRSLGLEKWGVGIEIESGSDGPLQYAYPHEKTIERIRRLKEAATAADIKFFASDELELLQDDCLDELNIVRMPHSMELVRLLPSGHVYWGAHALKDRAISSDPKWHPGTSAVNFITQSRGLSV